MPQTVNEVFIYLGGGKNKGGFNPDFFLDLFFKFVFLGGTKVGAAGRLFLGGGLNRGGESFSLKGGGINKGGINLPVLGFDGGRKVGGGKYLTFTPEAFGL